MEQREGAVRKFFKDWASPVGARQARRANRGERWVTPEPPKGDVHALAVWTSALSTAGAVCRCFFVFLCADRRTDFGLDGRAVHPYRMSKTNFRRFKAFLPAGGIGMWILCFNASRGRFEPFRAISWCAGLVAERRAGDVDGGTPSAALCGKFRLIFSTMVRRSHVFGSLKLAYVAALLAPVRYALGVAKAGMKRNEKREDVAAWRLRFVCFFG